MGRRSGLQNLQSMRMDKGRNRSSISEIKSEIPQNTPCEPPKASSKAGPVPHANSPLLWLELMCERGGIKRMTRSHYSPNCVTNKCLWIHQKLGVGIRDDVREKQCH